MHFIVEFVLSLTTPNGLSSKRRFKWNANTLDAIHIPIYQNAMIQVPAYCARKHDLLDVAARFFLLGPELLWMDRAKRKPFWRIGAAWSFLVARVPEQPCERRAVRRLAQSLESHPIFSVVR